MKLNKYVQSLFFLGFILANEAAPFLYNDTYTFRDMKWGYIIGFPLIYLIYKIYKKNKEKGLKNN